MIAHVHVYVYALLIDGSGQATWFAIVPVFQSQRWSFQQNRHISFPALLAVGIVYKPFYSL